MFGQGGEVGFTAGLWTPVTVTGEAGAETGTGAGADATFGSSRNGGGGGIASDSATVGGGGGRRNVGL